MVLEYLNTENGLRNKQKISSKHIDEMILIFFINTNILIIEVITLNKGLYHLNQKRK